MRSDVRPGGTLPGYARPDHTNTVRTLSDLQGEDSLILIACAGQTVHVEAGRMPCHPERKG